MRQMSGFSAMVEAWLWRIFEGWRIWKKLGVAPKTPLHFLRFFGGKEISKKKSEKCFEKNFEQNFRKLLSEPKFWAMLSGAIFLRSVIIF